MDNSSMKDDTEAYFVSGFFGRADLFLRDQPVSARVPEAIRQLACEVIDHGGFIISHLRFRTKHHHHAEWLSRPSFVGSSLQRKP